MKFSDYKFHHFLLNTNKQALDCRRKKETLLVSNFTLPLRTQEIKAL